MSKLSNPSASKPVRKPKATTGSQNAAPKTAPEISADAVQMALRMRYNPIRGLTMQRLVGELDNFHLGYLSWAAMTWDVMERRHHMLKGVASKRRKDVSRLKLEILKKDDSPEANAHEEALRDFYDNLTCVNAIDENEMGGVAMLLRTMMDSVGKYYAVHEIVWQPGETLTAEFRFTPLWFFENRTGRLRFLQVPLGGGEGDVMEPGGWLVTRGEGLMETCSILYALSSMPTKDWLAYSEKFGTPGVLGQTTAAKGSTAGQAMAAAVKAMGQDFGAVIYGSDGAIKEPISLIEAGRAGDLPFEPLIERCERAMAALWRGNDLSTMSADKKGASVQDGESNLILRDDAMLLSETLHIQVDRWVIWQLFGVDRPLAYAQIVVPESENTDLDLKIDTFLLGAGAQMGARERLEHYGRPEMASDDKPLHAVVATAERITDAISGKQEQLPAEEKLTNEATGKVADALGVPAGWISPITKLLSDIQAKAEDKSVSDADYLAFLEDAQKQLPELLGEMNTQELAEVFEAALGKSLIEGVKDGIRDQKTGAKGQKKEAKK